MKPTLTAFADSPDRGRGQARDMRVRWALEEVGQAYDVQLVTFDEMKTAAYRAIQPFGQIPALCDGDLTLFESGAIVLHVAQEERGLLPEAPAARARAVSWLFAALNTVEPPIVEREMWEFFEADKPWAEARRTMVEARVETRLGALSAHLADADWLDGGFSVGDLMMVTVLRRLEGSQLLQRHPSLCAYVERGAARPAYQRAFEAQAAVFRAAH